MNPVVIVKTAFGYENLVVSTNLNWSIVRFSNFLQNTVKERIQLERDDKVEIVLNRGLPYSELDEKLPETTTKINDYIVEHLGENTDRCYFYARIIRVVGNNEEYLKVIGDSIYIKKKDMEEVRSGLRRDCDVTRITETDMQRLPVMRVEPEICSICSENNVNTVCRYECRHLFCGQCSSRWRFSCALCRQRAL